MEIIMFLFKSHYVFIQKSLKFIVEGSVIMYKSALVQATFGRLYMMTSSNGKISALLDICAVNSPHKGQWHGALMASLICVWINGWVNNREAGDLRRHRIHYDVTVMIQSDKLSILIAYLLFISSAQRQLAGVLCDTYA